MALSHRHCYCDVQKACELLGTFFEKLQPRHPKMYIVKILPFEINYIAL